MKELCILLLEQFWLVPLSAKGVKGGYVEGRGWTWLQSEDQIR